ncbi:MAG: O-acetyl-ADP-ribose deacetylase [Bacteroidota bacterium]
MSSLIKLVKGDITLLKADAIVNAANSTLLGGGGVDGAIHRAAGPRLLKACQQLHGCDTGDAKITPGFRLPSRYVIHTVGPIWRGGAYNEVRLLSACYTKSLQLALDYNLKTIAFPNISTGVYGFPKELAALTAIKAVKTFLSEKESSIEVSFVVFDQENETLYNNLLLQN